MVKENVREFTPREKSTGISTKRIFVTTVWGMEDQGCVLLDKSRGCWRITNER